MKVNIVTDASGIFYRTLYTVNYGAKKGEKLLDTKKSQGIFMRELATDFTSILRSLEVDPCRVIFCMDSSSWRKKVEIKDGGYKSGRSQDESTVNWNAFYELTDKFADILSQKGYIISRVPGAEADDLLYFWSKRLNGIGENVILVTGDKDLLQILGTNENGSWTISLDPIVGRKKISVTQDVLELKPTESTNEADIFNPDSWSSSEDILKKLISNFEIQVVDIRSFCVQKVIVGDNGDSVPSVVTWPNKNPEKRDHGITESNYNKILAAAPGLETATWQDLYNGSFVEEISTTMETLKKITVNRELVKENLKRNCILMMLSNEVIPEQVFEQYNLMHETIPDLLAITAKDSILNGTEWWSSNSQSDFIPKSYDLFGDE